MAGSVDFDECFSAAQEISRKAGEIVRDTFAKSKEFSTKAGFADLVTETDQQVEKLVIGYLRQRFPSHSFIGEESAAEGVHFDLTDNPTWLIDPIDGTTNFVHRCRVLLYMYCRFPYVSISIALLVNKKAEIGLVYNPIREEMFTARHNQGAYLNGQRIHVSDIKALKNALVCAEFGSSRDSVQLDAKFRSMRAVLEQVHGIRALGSAALNMCSVAAGRLDAYWEFGLHAWDIAAGVVIVTEAGGVVSSIDGGPLNVMHRQVLCAANQTLADSISSLVESVALEHD